MKIGSNNGYRPQPKGSRAANGKKKDCDSDARGPRWQNKLSQI